MTVKFKPCKLKGNISAPPSKSMAHRYLIGAALSQKRCMLSGIDYSEDIIATINCLKELGTEIIINDDIVTINPVEFMKVESPILDCGESGSTLRFFIPIALCMRKNVILKGSERLLERPLDIYEEMCYENNFYFKKTKSSVTVCGKLEKGAYKIRGNISSQFITGIIFALVFLGCESTLEIIPPFESRSYVNLTISALKAFGVDIEFADEYKIMIKKSSMKAYSGRIEGDYSNAAFLDAFNYIGSEIVIDNLSNDSLQGDKVYAEYFEKISNGVPTLDISDCPDLGPVLFALASLKNGAVFTGTDRLKLKESDRGMAMHHELKKLGGGVIFGDNKIIVPKMELQYKGELLDGHNDHRIIMALSVILSKIGGEIVGVEAVKKSYPSFFYDIQNLGAKVEFN